jgi:hypothetical protein
MIPGKPFDPATETSRRPTPEKFAHLKKGVEPVVKNIKITSMADLVNINEQLLQSAELYISNLISRVIAQLIGKYGDGFVTLEATADGKLKVETEIETGATIGLDAGSNLIGNVKLSGCTLTVTTAKIDINSSGDNTIITATANQQIHIHCIVFTVAGEVNIVYKKGSTAFTGAMDFGGTDEPRGIVASHHLCPIELPNNQDFVINLSAAVQVSGYLCYHKE